MRDLVSYRRRGFFTSETHVQFDEHQECVRQKAARTPDLEHAPRTICDRARGNFTVVSMLVRSYLYRNASAQSSIPHTLRMYARTRESKSVT